MSRLSLVRLAVAAIIVSTLTGGVVIALGGTYAGLFCDDDALRAKVEKASAASGERTKPPASAIFEVPGPLRNRAYCSAIQTSLVLS